MLSWRGETAELSDLITYAKRFRIPLIGMASNAESTLLQASDVALVLPAAREACPMGLAPTTSTTLMLVLGDALAVALMERRGFSADRYRDFHPGGSLGRALVRVSDLMHTGAEVPLVGEKDSMQHVLIAIAEHRFGCVGVTDKKGALLGIITDGDLRRHMGGDLLDRKAAEIMTRDPKIARPDQLAAEALALMTDKKITQLFVSRRQVEEAFRHPAHPRLPARGARLVARAKSAGSAASQPLVPAKGRRDWTARGARHGAGRAALQPVRRPDEARPAHRPPPRSWPAVIVYSLLPRASDRVTVNAVKTGLIQNDLAMVKPKLTGTDEDGNPYVITAEIAIQDPKDIHHVSLQKVEADMTTKDAH